MNEIIEKEKIENMIYEIRGVQVMLSSSVAMLYQVETKVINQTIKRNIERFPKEFCFQLTEEEFSQISPRSQIVTLNKSNNYRGYNLKYRPYVLTEQGIMMLSGLLKSDIAVRVNIQIIDAFVKIRHIVNIDNKNKMLVNHEERILKLEESFDKFSSKQNYIMYEGKIYDAYSILLDIIMKQKKK